MRYLTFSALLAALSAFNVAVAGCGESEGHCYYYEKGALRSDAPCKIAECANMSGGLQTGRSHENFIIDNELPE